MTTEGRRAQPVLLFDGECGLCQRIVRLLLRADRAGRLKFAPLQGAAAQAWLRAHGLPTADFESIVFVPDWGDTGRGGFLLRTDAALAAARIAGGPWRFVTWTCVLPRRWRDAVYRLVARLRYAIFGRYRTQPLPPEWAGRFL